MTRFSPVIFFTLLLLATTGCAPAPTAIQRPTAPTNPVSTTALLASASALPVTSEDAIYFNTPAGAVKGYYAHPAAPGTYPGVVMIHEWWGLNDTIKTMARQLAAEGYQVLAVDLYHGQVGATPAESMKLVGALNQSEAISNLKAATQFLREHQASQIASLGWCFGGGQSLQLALAGEDLAATVLYYGTPVTDTVKLANIKQPVLGIFGDKDKSISVSTIQAFDTALGNARVSHEVYVYPGVGHAFANPTGANYAPNETKDAWQKTLAFLKKNVSGTSATTSTPRRLTPAWAAVITRLPSIIKPIADQEKMQVGRLFPPRIERLVDVSGDGVPEALVHIGDGGASANFVTLVRLVNGKPVAVPFTDEAMVNQPRIFVEGKFVEGGSIVHGNQIEFIPGGIVYYGGWARQNDGKLSECSVVAYVWNNSLGRLEKDSNVSGEIQKEYCAHQAANAL